MGCGWEYERDEWKKRRSLLQTANTFSSLRGTGTITRMSSLPTYDVYQVPVGNGTCRYGSNQVVHYNYISNSEKIRDK